MHGVVLYVHRWCNFNTTVFAVWQFRRPAFSRSKRLKLRRSGAPNFHAQNGSSSVRSPAFSARSGARAHFSICRGTYLPKFGVSTPPPPPGSNTSARGQGALFSLPIVFLRDLNPLVQCVYTGCLNKKLTLLNSLPNKNCKTFSGNIPSIAEGLIYHNDTKQSENSVCLS